MKCGEFEKRNSEFYKLYSEVDFFKNLLSCDQKNNSPIIFDVGAHKGESAKFFRDIFPNSEIFCFEPNPASVDHIQRLDQEKNKIFCMALSDYDGKANFNVQDISHLSSLNKVNRLSESSLGYSQKEKHEEIKVNVRMGDSIIDEFGLDVIDLLKIDVQSNEESTLRGFSKSINMIKNIIVEVSFYDFYERRSSIGGIENILTDFNLYDIFEISKNPKTLGTDWATLIYKNKSL